MRRDESGGGRGKALFALAVLCALAYIAYKALPAYIENYQLSDYMRQLAVQATVERSAAEAVRQNVVEHAVSLGLPVARDQVTVTSNTQLVNIQVDYTVPINLKVYTWVLHFTPSAENHSL